MRRLITLSIATLLISCEEKDLEHRSNPIDSKITIETREVLEPTSRGITLYCETEKIYPCVNFPIITEKEIQGSAIKVTFTSIGETVLCFTALGPATTSVDLSTLTNGEYEIELNNANLRNKGTLRVTDTDIDLLFEHEQGIDLVRPNTKRVPDNTYWGTIGYHVQPSSALVETFIQQLINRGAIFNKQTPGHYFYYEIDNSGEIVANTENSGYYFLRALIFRYEGDELALKNFIQTEGKDYGSALTINIQTYKGEQINNWQN